MMISLLKYLVAKIWFRSLHKKFRLGQREYDESFRQKWVFLQGQILTKGKMKWKWFKVFPRRKFLK